MAALQEAFDSPRGYPRRPANVVGHADYMAINLSVDVLYIGGRYMIRKEDDQMLILPDDIRDQVASGQAQYDGFTIYFHDVEKKLSRDSESTNIF